MPSNQTNIIEDLNILYAETKNPSVKLALHIFDSVPILGKEKLTQPRCPVTSIAHPVISYESKKYKLIITFDGVIGQISYIFKNTEHHPENKNYLPAEKVQGYYFTGVSDNCIRTILHLRDRVYLDA